MGNLFDSFKGMFSSQVQRGVLTEGENKEEQSQIGDGDYIDADIEEIAQERREKQGNTPISIQGVGSYASYGTGDTVGVQGVGSFANTKRQHPEAEANPLDEVIEGEVDTSPDDPLLGEGYVDGEIILNELDGEEYKQLYVGDSPLLEANERLQLMPAQDEIIETEIDFSEAELERLRDGEDAEDEYGLGAADAFTDIVYEDFDDDERDIITQDEAYNEGMEVLDNDLSQEGSQFVANSFETQGVLAPFYPSEDLAFAGFSDPKDLDIEDDFAYGDIKF
jgi:hypothetical protein